VSVFPEFNLNPELLRRKHEMIQLEEFINETMITEYEISFYDFNLDGEKLRNIEMNFITWLGNEKTVIIHNIPRHFGVELINQVKEFLR